MLAFLYSNLIFKFKLIVWLISFVDTKTKKRINGLSRQKKNLDQQLTTISKKRILVHCASLGEYEQALPIINWVIENTKFDIVVSFFSPSGYENCLLSDVRCLKCYLPFDLNREMKLFLSKVNPQKVIITKNEWWWNMLRTLKSNKTPTFLISSTIRNDHYFIKFPLSFFKKRLSTFSSIFVLNLASQESLSALYSGTIIVSGDTRKDQVVSTKNNICLKQTTDPTVIYGSVWLSDLPVIKEMINELSSFNHFVYPHNLTAENINSICAELNCNSKDSISELSGTCVISSMGQLKKDYSSAQIAYIGGGFGNGIHNILEAAVYNIPTLFGPRFHKSEEAKELIQMNVAYSVSNFRQLKPILQKLCTNEYQEEINLKLIDYFSASKSATEIICTKIFNNSGQPKVN